MAKKLGGKYKAPAQATPSSPTTPSSPVRTSEFAPKLHSTPTSKRPSISGSSRVGSGEKVTKLLRKQSLTRHQLSKIYPNRTEKILKLSKQQREPGMDEREKETAKPAEEVHEKAESTVVKDGNTIKSNIGFIRTIQEEEEVMDDEETENGKDSGNCDAVGNKDTSIVNHDAEGEDDVENVAVDASIAVESLTKSKKRKTPKEVRQAKPKTIKRSTARSHQNFRDRYLTVKKRIDVLQPDHGLEQEFFVAVKNNLQDPNVRGAASTAGKWMVYGKGELLGKFLGGGIKYEKKKMVMMANAVDFKEIKPKVDKNDDQSGEDSDDDGSEEDDLGEEGDPEESFIHVAKRQRRTQNREDSPEPDLYNIGGTAISVRTPGS